MPCLPGAVIQLMIVIQLCLVHSYVAQICVTGSIPICRRQNKIWKISFSIYARMYWKCNVRAWLFWRDLLNVVLPIVGPLLMAMRLRLVRTLFLPRWYVAMSPVHLPGQPIVHLRECDWLFLVSR